MQMHAHLICSLAALQLSLIPSTLSRQGQPLPLRLRQLHLLLQAVLLQLLGSQHSRAAEQVDLTEGPEGRLPAHNHKPLRQVCHSVQGPRDWLVGGTSCGATAVGSETPQQRLFCVASALAASADLMCGSTWSTLHL